MGNVLVGGLLHRPGCLYCQWTFPDPVRGLHQGASMIEFPPEFYGMVAALWSTYQYTIVIWLALTFGAVMVLGFSILIWNLVHPFYSF